MKKLRKRIFAAVLAALMIVTAMPVTALYTSAETGSVSGNAAGQAGTEEREDLDRELTEDEQGQLDLSRVTELQGALDNANAPMTADDHTEQQDTDEASVTTNGETLYYATLEEAFAAANGQTATITMLTDADVGRRIEGDANRKLFFQPLSN